MPLVLTALAFAFATPVEFEHFTPATCEDPARRSALLSANMEEPAFMTAMKKKSAEQEARMDLLLGRLVARARLTPEEKARIALDLMKAPGFEQAMNEGLSLVSDMFASLGKIAGGKDERTNCLLLVELMGKLPAIEANADRQWSIMEQALRGEAAKRNVSLEP
jgi:hypothetical protein